MKKYLFLVSVAAVALTACTNESVEYVGDAPQAKEIAFQAITRPNTRAALDGTTFPTTLDMKVAAYQVSATGGSAGVYFDATTYKHGYKGGSDVGGTYWGGQTAKYWPLTAAYINFLAIANANADNAAGVTWGTDKADQVTIVMSDNSSAQRDLMYARGDGQVTQSGNALTFPEKVDMVFKHAQAWIGFQVKAASSVETAIKINSITLNGAKYNGTYTVTHTAYDANTGQSVAGAWSALPGSGSDVTVPGWTPATALTTDFATVGNGLMIVPDDTGSDDFTSFTIAYTYDGKAYTYTYTPESRSVDQAKHYIYQITFKLHEIFINPTIDDWKTDVNGNSAVDDPFIVPIASYSTKFDTNLDLTCNEAGQYTVYFTGMTANQSGLSIVTDNTSDIFKVAPALKAASADANGIAAVTFSVLEHSAAKSGTITLKISDTNYAVVTISQTAP